MEWIAQITDPHSGEIKKIGEPEVGARLEYQMSQICGGDR